MLPKALVQPLLLEKSVVIVQQPAKSTKRTNALRDCVMVKVVRYQPNNSRYRRVCHPAEGTSQWRQVEIRPGSPLQPPLSPPNMKEETWPIRSERRPLRPMGQTGPARGAKLAPQRPFFINRAWVVIQEKKLLPRLLRTTQAKYPGQIDRASRCPRT